VRISTQQAPTSPTASRPAAAAVLSAASARTPAFRALFPQLRLLGRVLKELLPQTPRWPMPSTPRPSGPRQGRGEAVVDRFAPPAGRGIPIRISACGPHLPVAPLPLRPWLGSPLKPWCGTTLKPWVRLPHIFTPFLRPGGHVACQVVDCGGTRGKGIPIRIS
jgi:hypothetical protein